MAKRMQQHTLSAEVAEATEAAQTAKPAPKDDAASVTPEQVAQLILKGSNETKEAIRKALDLDKTHTRQRRSKVTNSQVRNHVRAVGEVTHIPGFVPSPPARVSDRGPEAVQIWTDRWLDNNGDNLSEYDLDQIAEGAEM
jgi:hypothetical protein